MLPTVQEGIVYTLHIRETLSLEPTIFSCIQLYSGTHAVTMTTRAVTMTITRAVTMTTLAVTMTTLLTRV